MLAEANTTPCGAKTVLLGVVHQTMVDILMINGGNTVGSLASETARIVNSQYNTFPEGFLVTHVEIDVIAEGLTVNEELVFGMAYGAVSLTDIEETLQRTVKARLDQDQSVMRRIVGKFGLWHLLTRADGGDSFSSHHIMKSFGKGIPFPEDQGFQFFIYNPRIAAMTTGGEVRLVGIIYGVWL